MALHPLRLLLLPSDANRLLKLLLPPLPLQNLPPLLQVVSPSAKGLAGFLLLLLVLLPFLLPRFPPEAEETRPRLLPVLLLFLLSRFPLEAVETRPRLLPLLQQVAVAAVDLLSGTAATATPQPLSLLLLLLSLLQVVSPSA